MLGEWTQRSMSFSHVNQETRLIKLVHPLVVRRRLLPQYAYTSGFQFQRVLSV